MTTDASVEIEKLRRALDRAGIRQKDLAQAAGVSQSYVSLVLKGGRPPSDRLLAAAARLLGPTEEPAMPFGEPSAADLLELSIKHLERARLTLKHHEERPHAALHDLLDDLLDRRPNLANVIEGILQGLNGEMPSNIKKDQRSA